MCPTASITLACLITFYHFQSCPWPRTVPTAQAFSVCENFQWGAVYNNFLQQAQQQWCPGHFLSPKMGGRSSVQQQVQKQTAALHSGESLRERRLLGRKIWGWNTVRGQAAYHKAVLPSTNYKLKSHSHFYSWVCAGMYVIMMPNSLRELGLWGWSCGRNADFPQLFTWLTPFRLGVSSSIAFPDVFLLSYQKHAICHTLNSTLFTSYRHLSMG